MTRRTTFFLSMISLGALALLETGCRRQPAETTRKFGFDDFVPIYNRHIENWIKTQQLETGKELARVKAELATADGDAAEHLQTRMQALEKDQEKWNFRLSLGDYLKTGDPSEIPTDLVWQNGMDQPEIGDPAAKKGGVLRFYQPTFPPTLRPFGENSNNGFRNYIYDDISLPMVLLHPETMKEIPALAREWAVSKDNRTVFFHIDPEARYSDGRPVRAKDFLIGAYVRVSDYIVNPYQKQYYRESIAQIAMYDDLTVSVSLPESGLYAAATAGGIEPASPDFYAEYGPDFSERYQWRFPPTTGAYEVLPEDIVKGASITQTRIKDWWARDKKFYRYRFNPDKILHRVVRDDSKAFELFRAGEFDTFLITRPELWYEKSQIPPVYDGYIDRVTFHTRFPKIPIGMYLNVAKPPLDNRNVRIGIACAMNWKKVIEVLYRGDYQRLNAFNEGFGVFSDPTIKARPYSIDLARAAFREAGYTREDRDGYLTKPDGTRLSVSITYFTKPIFDRVFAILREDAKACGLELRLDGLEFTVAYKKETQKQHEMVFSNRVGPPPVPDFYQYLHSTNARDEKGNIKPNTNNLFSWGRPDTDALSEKVRTGATVEEVSDASKKLQRIIHDEAIFIPGYAVDFVRMASWRWVRWPDCENTRFSPSVVYDPRDTHVLWIDENIREETNAARRSGKVFPESTRTIDVYREVPEAAPEIVKPEPETPTGSP